MVKKEIKIVSLILIFLLMFTITVQAVTVTKETIKKNLESYSMTGKVASAVVGNSKYTVGGDATDISSLAITDDTISFISSSTPLVFKYTISGNTCTFTAQADITNQTNTSDYLTETLKVNLLSACFLAVTDSFGIDSSDALYYYEERVATTKLNIDYTGIDNQDYLNLSKEYVENVDSVNDAVFKQYTKTLTNNNTNCKYETILEVNLNQVANIKVDVPNVQNTSPTTPTTPTTNENVFVNTAENEIANELTNETTNTTENEIGNNEVANVEANVVNNETVEDVQAVEQGGSVKTVLKGVAIVALITIVVIAIILFERKK